MIQNSDVKWTYQWLDYSAWEARRVETMKRWGQSLTVGHVACHAPSRRPGGGPPPPRRPGPPPPPPPRWTGFGSGAPDEKIVVPDGILVWGARLGGIFYAGAT
jgi:hypothetical protein